MSSSLSRLSGLVALCSLVPACDLYIRSDDDDTTTPPDARVIDAELDAPVPPDAPAWTNTGFVNPTTTTRANVFRNGAWQDAGPADWSCTAQPPAEPVPAMGYALSGTVRDFASGTGIGAATIAALGAGQVLGQTSSSSQAGSRGQYRVNLLPLPAGATRVRFQLFAPMVTQTTVVVDRYLGQSSTATLDLRMVSDTTVRALPALIDVTQDPAASLVLGELRDCQGRRVSGAVAALSMTPTFVSHWPDGTTFYFSGGSPSTSVPVRHTTLAQTNQDGLFLIVNPRADDAIEGHVQAWGYPTEADRAAGTLRLLGRQQAPVKAGNAANVLLGRSG